jgi:hypothetical protein
LSGRDFVNFLDRKVLTREIVEQFLADDSWNFAGFKAIEDEAAEELAKYDKGLYIYHLRELSDAAADSLSKHEGDFLWLDSLPSLSDAAAESFSKYKGGLRLAGLTELSDAAAESLSKHEGGELRLHGLTELSVAVAKSLSTHMGGLGLGGLTELSDEVAEILSAHMGDWLWLDLDNLPESAAKILRDAGHE